MGNRNNRLVRTAARKEVEMIGHAILTADART